MKTHLISVVAATAATLIALSSAPLAQGIGAVDGDKPGFAPDINNGGAYNNNVILGFTPDRSYVRFANVRDTQEPIRNYIEVYNLETKRSVGRFELDVHAKQSVQLSYRNIVERAGLRYADAVTQDLVLYVQNGREKQLWQHVHYNPANRKLENATVCSVAPHADYIAPHNVVINAHTSTMKTQASLISLHNFGDNNATFQANIYDGATGRAIGFVPITLNSRQSFNESASWFEEQMGHKPGPADFHYNIEFVPTSFPHGKLVTGHIVLNTETGDATNLSNPCALHGGIVTIDFPT